MRLIQFFIGVALLALSCYLLVILPMLISVPLGTLFCTLGWILILACLINEYQATLEYQHNLKSHEIKAQNE